MNRGTGEQVTAGEVPCTPGAPRSFSGVLSCSPDLLLFSLLLSTTSSAKRKSGRGDWPNFEPRPPTVRRFVTAFSGLSQPHLLTAARLGREGSAYVGCR